MSARIGLPVTSPAMPAFPPAKQHHCPLKDPRPLHHFRLLHDMASSISLFLLNSIAAKVSTRLVILHYLKNRPTDEAVTITSCPCLVDFEIHEIWQVDSPENH